MHGPTVAARLAIIKLIIVINLNEKKKKKDGSNIVHIFSVMNTQCASNTIPAYTHTYIHIRQLRQHKSTSTETGLGDTEKSKEKSGRR